MPSHLTPDEQASLPALDRDTLEYVFAATGRVSRRLRRLLTDGALSPAVPAEHLDTVLGVLQLHDKTLHDVHQLFVDRLRADTRQQPARKCAGCSGEFADGENYVEASDLPGATDSKGGDYCFTCARQLIQQTDPASLPAFDALLVTESARLDAEAGQ